LNRKNKTKSVGLFLKTVAKAGIAPGAALKDLSNDLVEHFGDAPGAASLVSIEIHFM
jgi:hypothetical protein